MSSTTYRRTGADYDGWGKSPRPNGSAATICPLLWYPRAAKTIRQAGVWSGANLGTQSGITVFVERAIVGRQRLIPNVIEGRSRGGRGEHR